MCLLDVSCSQVFVDLLLPSEVIHASRDLVSNHHQVLCGQHLHTEGGRE